MSMNFKSQIAPKNLQFRPGDMVISDKFCTILTIISYPKMISHAYLANISQLAGVKVIIKHIPIQFSTLSKTTNKEMADMKARFPEDHDNTLRERIRQDYESLEGFVSMLA